MLPDSDLGSRRNYDLILDWDAESKHMGKLYSNSFLSIAAASSPGSEAGFLKDHGPLHCGTDSMPLRVSDDPARHETVSLIPSVQKEDEEALNYIHSHAPLHKRGWCFQESNLAPRILTYGKQQIYFRCE